VNDNGNNNNNNRILSNRVYIYIFIYSTVIVYSLMKDGVVPGTWVDRQEEDMREKEGRKDGMVPCYTQQVKYPNIRNFVPYRRRVH